MELLQLLVSGIAQGCVYGLIALGFVLIYKATETVTFAQGDLMMLGAFGGFIAMSAMGLPFWAAAIATVIVMTLLGVPAPQIKLIEDHYPGGITSYVKDKLRHVMSALPARENYFWRVYMTGSYTLSCCPNYLREENLPVLARRAGALHTHTATVSDFLRKNPGVYSHYVLFIPCYLILTLIASTISIVNQQYDHP